MDDEEDAYYKPRAERWEPHFAWLPVKDIHGRRHWLKHVYRRYNWALSTEQPFGRNYSYGTIFDVIRTAQ